MRHSFNDYKVYRCTDEVAICMTNNTQWDVAESEINHFASHKAVAILLKQTGFTVSTSIYWRKWVES